MYPKEWIAAGGKAEFSAKNIIEELENMARLTSDEQAKKILMDAAHRLKG